MFGEWNGVQNFLSPAVLAFLFDKVSFFKWIAAVLTYQRQYLPLFMYLITLFFLFFIIIKAAIQWKMNIHGATVHPKARLWNDLLLPLIIKFHKWLFIFISVMVIIFIAKVFYAYIYRSNLPMYLIFINMIRIGLIIGFLYIYALLDVAIPVIRKGRCFKKAQDYFHLILVKRWKTALPFCLVQLLWIYISVLLFRLVINQIAYINDLGLLTLSHKSLLINFYDVSGTIRFVFNIVATIFGFLLSNLLYSPFMLITRKGFDYFKFNLRNG